MVLQPLLGLEGLTAGLASVLSLEKGHNSSLRMRKEYINMTNSASMLYPRAVNQPETQPPARVLLDQWLEYAIVLRTLLWLRPKR